MGFMIMAHGYQTTRETPFKPSPPCVVVVAIVSVAAYSLLSLSPSLMYSVVSLHRTGRKTMLCPMPHLHNLSSFQYIIKSYGHSF